MAYLNKYSQNGEEQHILHYLDTIGITKGHLVDLGAGDGYTMSNTRALLDRGWTGDLYDGDPKGAKDVHRLFIRLEDAHALIPSHCDFLNLDLDGNDFHILSEALRYTHPGPSLIVCEINPIFQRDEAKVMPYNAEHVWDGSVYYGMSLGACEKLAYKFGYVLAYIHAGINAFLLRKDHAEKHPELIRPIWYLRKFDHAADTKQREWLTL